MSMNGKRLVAIYRNDEKLDLSEDLVQLMNCMNCGPLCLINGAKLDDGECLYFELMPDDDHPDVTERHLVYVEHSLFGAVEDRLRIYNRNKHTHQHYHDFRIDL